MAPAWASVVLLVLVQAWSSAVQGQEIQLEAARETMREAANEVVAELRSEGEDDGTLVLIQDEAWERELFTSEAGLKEAARLQESLAFYDTAASKMAAPQLLPSDQCSPGALETVNAVLEKLPVDGVARPLTSIAVLQSQGCKDGALQVASALLQLVRAARPTQETPSTARHRSHHCEEVGACRTKGLTQVRDLFSSEPDLLLLYDGVASSVFGAQNQGDVARALADDVIEDLESEEVKVELRKRRSLAAMETEFRHRRGTCVNKTEQKVQSWLSWIPFIGTIYNLVSAAVYAAKGCKDVAKDRAIEGAIDLAMDVVSVATAGAGAAVSAARVAVKAGTKLVSKAAVNVAKNAFKKAAKSALKSTVKNYLNPIKGAITEVKDLGKLVKNVGKTVYTGVKTGVKRVVKKVSKGVSSFRKTGKSVSKSVANGGEAITDLRRADGALGDVKHADANVRCRRTPGCDLNKRKLQDTMKRDHSDALEAMEKNKDRMAELWKKKKGFQDVASDIKKDFNLDIKDKFSNRYPGTYLDLTEEALTNKEMFKALQQHQVFDGAEKVLYVKQNIGGRKVYYRTVPSSVPFGRAKDQFVVEVLDTTQRNFVAKKYDDIVGALDDFAKQRGVSAAQKRKEMAETMLQAINNKQNSQPDFAAVFDSADLGGSKARRAKDAAEDWIIITQTAEAAAPGASRKAVKTGPLSTNWQDHLKEKLGRIPGADDTAQKLLTEIVENPELTFKDLMEKFPSMQKGGLQKSRDLLLDPPIAPKNADDIGRRRRFIPFLMMH